MNFPSLPEPEEIREPVLSPIIKSEFDAPYQTIRKKWTAPSKTITFIWGKKVSLPENNYMQLERFFLENQTIAFYLTNPLTLRRYSVTFDQDGLDFEQFCPGYRSGQLQFRLSGIYVTTTTTTTSTTN